MILRILVFGSGPKKGDTVSELSVLSGRGMARQKTKVTPLIFFGYRQSLVRSRTKKLTD
jgi:hypothetical protein